MLAFYQGARQTIYGHGSWRLSFSDNHSDLATATIRQAVEIRLRRAFGIFGKIKKEDDAIVPIPLSDLLESIDTHRDSISFPIRFENIKRIYGWSNMYLHAALKFYAWCPPRVLSFLRLFLLGGQAPGWMHNSNAGVVLDQATFEDVRRIVRLRHEGAAFEIYLPIMSDCEALVRTPTGSD